jgi:hypothetical protein
MMARRNSRRNPTFEEEERLDGYRQTVEQLLGRDLVLADDEEFDRFFDHVVAHFERGAGEGEGARSWQSVTSSPPRSPGADP